MGNDKIYADTWGVFIKNQPHLIGDHIMTVRAGKKAIVTGGAMGIGLATCKRLIREGCDVTIWDLSQKDMDKAAEELKTLGGNVFHYLCDVSFVI